MSSLTAFTAIDSIVIPIGITNHSSTIAIVVTCDLPNMLKNRITINVENTASVILNIVVVPDSLSGFDDSVDDMSTASIQ